MEINKSIKLKKISEADGEVFWSFNDWQFSWVIGDSRFDIRHPDGHWTTNKIYGKHTKNGAIEAIKQYLTIKGVK